MLGRQRVGHMVVERRRMRRLADGQGLAACRLGEGVTDGRD